jgi:hypothetical protein
MIRINAAWYRKESAAHSRALAAPQAFPLTGDGITTRSVIERHKSDPAAALVEARYRDWRWQKEQEEVTPMLEQAKCR